MAAEAAAVAGVEVGAQLFERDGVGLVAAGAEGAGVGSLRVRVIFR